MSIQLLDNQEFSLVLDALQLMQSELAMTLANQLLTHNPPSPHSLEDVSVEGRQYPGGCAISSSKGSHQMQPYPQPYSRNSRNLAMGGSLHWGNCSHGHWSLVRSVPVDGEYSFCSI